MIDAAGPAVSLGWAFFSLTSEFVRCTQVVERP
jgi:hypothetical protein